MNIYHYCSLDTFTKIVSGKTLRLSDISKSNDSTEINWITKYIKEVFIKSYNDDNAGYFKTSLPIEIFEELVDFNMKNFFSDEIRMYEFFVCCFSEKSDLLSQWRGYADDGNGVSIGFDKEIIDNFVKLIDNRTIKSSVIRVDKVVYKESEQRKIVKSISLDLIAKLKEQIKLFSKNNDIDRPLLSSDDIKKNCLAPFNNAFLKLFEESIFSKNIFFKEEAEWRICRYSEVNERVDEIKISDEINISKVMYFNRRNDIVPYLNLFFDKMKSNFIKEVILGPKCNARIEDIETYLKSNGINSVVKRSEGTYR